jgi:hypothetical protein
MSYWILTTCGSVIELKVKVSLPGTSGYMSPWGLRLMNEQILRHMNTIRIVYKYSTHASCSIACSEGGVPCVFSEIFS